MIARRLAAVGRSSAVIAERLKRGENQGQAKGEKQVFRSSLPALSFRPTDMLGCNSSRQSALSAKPAIRTAAAGWMAARSARTSPIRRHVEAIQSGRLCQVTAPAGLSIRR
jgi:hypothetical protein